MSGHTRNTGPSIMTPECICRGMGITLCQFFDEDGRMGLTAGQAQPIREWSRLDEDDKRRVGKPAAALGRSAEPR